MQRFPQLRKASEGRTQVAKAHREARVGAAALKLRDGGDHLRGVLVVAEGL